MGTVEIHPAILGGKGQNIATQSLRAMGLLVLPEGRAPEPAAGTGEQKGPVEIRHKATLETEIKTGSSMAQTHSRSSQHSKIANRARSLPEP
jgi:hypothetical protein